MSATISPPSSRTSSTIFPAGARTGRQVLEAFWRDFKPKTAEVMEQKPSRDHRGARRVPRALICFPTRATAPTRASARPAATGGWRCAAASSARSSPAPTIPSANITRRFGQAGGGGRGCRDRRCSGQDPETGQDVTLRSGRFGPYVQLGDGKEAKRASIAQGCAGRRGRTSSRRCGCCRCRARSATIRRRGKPITASIGRYGPYLAHDGKYAKLASTAEVFEVGMNAAVAKLADAANGGGRRARRARAAEDARRASAHRASRSS